MAWLTPAELTAAVRSVLGMAPTAAVPSHWAEVVAAAVDSARGEITTALADRGFTPDQIAAWDRLREYHRAVGLYRAFQEATIARDDGTAALDKYGQWLAELQTVRLTIGGAVQRPAAAPSPGRIRVGREDFSGERIGPHFEA